LRGHGSRSRRARLQPPPCYNPAGLLRRSVNPCSHWKFFTYRISTQKIDPLRPRSHQQPAPKGTTSGRTASGKGSLRKPRPQRGAVRGRWLYQSCKLQGHNRHAWKNGRVQYLPLPTPLQGSRLTVGVWFAWRADKAVLCHSPCLPRGVSTSRVRRRRSEECCDQLCSLRSERSQCGTTEACVGEATK
jgi:hypothetical protein